MQDMDRGVDQYVWLGMTTAEERIDLGSDAGASLATVEEELFEADPQDSWDPGKRVGMVYISYIVTPSGTRANVQATFDVSELFDVGDSIVAVGSLTFDDVVRGGRLSVTGGTGRFRGARGQADVDHRNPHKYHVSSTTT
jgi:hypothetical protein